MTESLGFITANHDADMGDVLNEGKLYNKSLRRAKIIIMSMWVMFKRQES